MGNCIVTKMKGDSQNSSLKYLGEAKFVLQADLSVGVSWRRTVTLFGVKSGTRFVAEGISSLSVIDSNLNIIRNLEMAGELPTGAVILHYTGSGTLKVYPKYELLRVNCNVCVRMDNLDNFSAVKFTTDNFGIVQDVNASLVQPYVYDAPDNTVILYKNISTNKLFIPLLKDFSGYDKLRCMAIDNEDLSNVLLSFSYYKQEGWEYNCQGDIVSLTNIQNLPHINAISIYDKGPGSNLYISSFAGLTAKCYEKCASLVLRGIKETLSGTDIDAVASWEALRYLNFNYNTIAGVEWKPVFDAWKASGKYKSCSVEIWVKGTFEGNDISTLHHVVFDASGEYVVNA